MELVHVDPISQESKPSCDRLDLENAVLLQGADCTQGELEVVRKIL